MVGTALPANAAEAEVENGDLWLLRRYEVGGCKPKIPPPTVFDWLGSKTIGIGHYLATSADCGLVGTRDTDDGWTYVYWSSENFAGRLIRRAVEKFNLTQLAGLVGDRVWREPSIGPYEPFVLIQLKGEWPVRVWAHGTASLEVEIRPGGEEAFEVRARSKSAERECVSAWRPLNVGQAEDRPREALPCS